MDKPPYKGHLKVPLILHNNTVDKWLMGVGTRRARGVKEGGAVSPLNINARSVIH